MDQERRTHLNNIMSANTQNVTIEKNGGTFLGANCDCSQDTKYPPLKLSTETEDKSTSFQVNPREADEQSPEAETNEAIHSAPDGPSVSSKEGNRTTLTVHRIH